MIRQLFSLTLLTTLALGSVQQAHAMSGWKRATLATASVAAASAAYGFGKEILPSLKTIEYPYYTQGPRVDRAIVASTLSTVAATLTGIFAYKAFTGTPTPKPGAYIAPVGEVAVGTDMAVAAFAMLDKRNSIEFNILSGCVGALGGILATRGVYNTYQNLKAGK